MYEKGNKIYIFIAWNGSINGNVESLGYKFLHK